MARTYENCMFLANGKVLEFTFHASDRQKQRVIDYDRVAHTVVHGVQIPDGQGNMRFKYGITVVVIKKITANTYRVISVWEDSRRAA